MRRDLGRKPWFYPLPVLIIGTYDENGVPYLPWQSCARLSGRVVSRQDLGSHTLFVAELEQAQVLSDREPLTYAYYQRELKPKSAIPCIFLGVLLAAGIMTALTFGVIHVVN